MTPFQTDDFMTKLLQGAFDKWQPSSYWWSFWRKKLEQIDIDAAKAALALYAENKTKTETDPTWQRFADYLKKAAFTPGHRNTVDNYKVLIAQCYCHRIPAVIGQIWSEIYFGNQEDLAAEEYLVRMAEAKGGFWDIKIAYGIDGENGERAIKSKMRAKKNQAWEFFMSRDKTKTWKDLHEPLERDYYLVEVSQQTNEPIKPCNWQNIRLCSQNEGVGDTAGRADIQMETGGNYGGCEDMPF